MHTGNKRNSGGTFRCVSPGNTRIGRMLCAYLLTVGAGICSAQSQRVFEDPVEDARIRRTDVGDDGPYDPLEHAPAELASITLGAWAPFNPARDLFEGRFDRQGGFVRLDLVLAGLMNPPGQVAKLFDPYAFGPNPVIGFVEIDVDADVRTGGELRSPMQRYLGVAARFGGLPPEPRFHNRAARWFEDFLLGFNEPPFTKRHGEEFHLDFVGEFVADGSILIIDGDDDRLFECGETWWVIAPLFHRAHGYERYSFAFGCGRPGQYIPPESIVQFSHDDSLDQTTVSLVFPLTNEADAEHRNETPQGNDGNACNQSSVLEALADLVVGAQWYFEHPSGEPEEDIILAWRDKNPLDHLDPHGWTLTAALGVPYSREDPDSLLVVYTDVFPNPLLGDVNGDGASDESDRAATAEFVRLHGEGGRFTIQRFAHDFNVFDINYDGAVDAFDVNLRPRPGDADGDDDVDLLDARAFWICFGEQGPMPPPCRLMDFDQDERITLRDYRRFVQQMRGPRRR